MAAAEAGQERAEEGAGSQAPSAASGNREVVGRSASGAAATALVGLLARGAGLLTTVVVTHFVSKAAYGNANLAMIVVGVLHALTMLTPQQALLTRREGFEEASALCRYYVAWSGVALVVALLLSGRAIVSALGQPEATALVFVYLASMMLERVAVVPALRLNYQLRFRELAALDLWANVGYVAVTIGAAVLGLGGYSLPLGMVARHGLRLALLARLGTDLWPARPPFGPEGKRLAAELLAYALPVHLAGMGEFLSMYLDNVFAGKAYSAAAQGLYVVGYTLAMTPADTIASHGATAMIRALGLPSAAARQRALLQSLRYLALVLFPIGVLTACSAATLEQVLLPPRWHGVALVVVALCPGAMSQVIKRVCFVQLTSIHRPRVAALLEGVRLSSFLLGLYLVTVLDGQRQHLSYVGWAVSGSFVLSALVNLAVSLRCDGLRLRDGLRALSPPLLGAAVTGAACLLLGRGLDRLALPLGLPRLLVECGAGAAVYVLYLRLLHLPIYREASAWLREQLRRRG